VYSSDCGFISPEQLIHSSIFY